MGYTTIALFAHGCPDQSLMEDYIKHVTLVPDGEAWSPFSPEVAALRQAFLACRERLSSSGRGSAVESSVPQGASHRPKMSVAEAKSLRGKFMKAYPGELLAPSTMPSLSFLQLVKDQLDNGGVSWVPWKSRTSEATELEFLENRRPRNDRQLLHSLLSDGPSAFEDVPEAKIPKNEPVELVLSRFQILLTNCLALLEAAHLLVLKRFHQKFLDVAVLKPRDPNLRPPSLNEILDADRAVWLAVADIVRENRWSLNDSLNEVAFCRQDIHSALQPRLISTGPKLDSRKRQRDDLEQQQKVLPKPPADHKRIWQDSWCRKTASGQGICIRWHMTQCKTGSGCRYAHVCPIPGPDGKPCGLKHKVAAHDKTPH